MCTVAVYFLKLDVEEQRARGRLCFSVDSGLESLGRTRRSDGVQRRLRKYWKSEAESTERDEQEKPQPWQRGWSISCGGSKLVGRLKRDIGVLFCIPVHTFGLYSISVVKSLRHLFKEPTMC